MLNSNPPHEIDERVCVDKVVMDLTSSRMSDSPCAHTTSEYGWSSNVERIMKARP